MTSEQLSLLPARRDDDAASPGRFELAVRGVLELAEGIGPQPEKDIAKLHQRYCSGGASVREWNRLLQ